VETAAEVAEEQATLEAVANVPHNSVKPKETPKAKTK